MRLGPTEVIVGSCPKITNGVRNEFIDLHVEMLRDASIPARIATLAEVGHEHTPGWAEERGDWEPLFIVVPKDYRSQALQINQTLVDVKICLQCEAYIKPGATKCPRCGASDERDFLKSIPVGGRVRVKPRSFLEQFQRESKYPHPLSNAQLEAAGTTDTVKGAGIHRDGYALVELTGTQGIWHEECLEWLEQGCNW
jgi:ribosomal protein L40E